MTKYKAELHSDNASRTVEFESDKTNIALTRELKKKLNCAGFKMTMVIHVGNYKQWSSPDFCMTLDVC